MANVSRSFGVPWSAFRETAKPLVSGHLLTDHDDLDAGGCLSGDTVDDGSTEDLRASLAAYRRRIAYIRQDDAGAGAACNAGLRVAVGDYIAFLDHDDLWLAEKLEAF